jgi:hypothetical protein
MKWRKYKKPFLGPNHRSAVDIIYMYDTIVVSLLTASPVRTSSADCLLYIVWIRTTSADSGTLHLDEVSRGDPNDIVCWLSYVYWYYVTYASSVDYVFFIFSADLHSCPHYSSVSSFLSHIGVNVHTSGTFGVSDLDVTHDPKRSSCTVLKVSLTKGNNSL